MSAAEDLTLDASEAELAAEFQTRLIALIPAMRAFARGLCHSRHEADDLAQETLYRALSKWRSFTPGTNLKAWVFTILRNHFYSTRRANRRLVDLDPEILERELTTSGDISAVFELDDVRRGLARLPPEQREAIMLICAAGLTYEEAASVAGCAMGTAKSRLSRGRASLAALVESGAVAASDGLRPSSAFAALLSEAQQRNAPRDEEPPSGALGELRDLPRPLP